MRAAGYGRIVNVASIAGKEGGRDLRLRRSEGGVIAFTKSLAKELTPVERARQRHRAGDHRDRPVQGNDAEHIETMKAKHSDGRFLRIDEIAAMVAWIASRECSSRPAPPSTSPADARRTDASHAPTYRCCRWT
jgi:3-oxoacyl-[acyl-carrier protein] reductase